MVISIAHLGPAGTHSETATLAYSRFLKQKYRETLELSPYPSIAQSLYAVANQEVTVGVVPVENSTEGSVGITLDTLWELAQLQIQQELVLPIHHTLISRSTVIQDLQTVYSHPQALAQCQKWLDRFLPKVTLIPTNSTTEALNYVESTATAAAIASPRAAQLYNLPILADNINDYPDNCTRFWVVGLTPTTSGSKLSLAFSVSKNIPGALVKPLQVFASRNINLSRIESRPTKRSLGEYLFFIDLENNPHQPVTPETLSELSLCTEVIKSFGSYDLLKINCD